MVAPSVAVEWLVVNLTVVRDLGVKVPNSDQVLGGRCDTRDS